MHLGISHLIIESDCQVVVNEMHHFEASCSPMDNLFQDINALMAYFQHCNIQFCHRKCNEVANRISRHAWDVNHVVMWFG